ncbi:MAG: hypothetical protein L0271_05490 [Gemmatimonadetes bacterium]|nr:hypothetical protein [Gemmatimonadota bacterium]
MTEAGTIAIAGLLLDSSTVCVPGLPNILTVPVAVRAKTPGSDNCSDSVPPPPNGTTVNSALFVSVPSRAVISVQPAATDFTVTFRLFCRRVLENETDEGTLAIPGSLLVS